MTSSIILGLSDRYSTVPSLLPFARNVLFTGRENELATLSQALLEADGHRRLSIFGFGGCGKSAVALELAYRAIDLDAMWSVFWVPAISQQTFELAFREIGTQLCVPGISKDDVDVERLVQQFLASDKVPAWLMIIDNADDPDILLQSNGSRPRLYDYLPSNPNGRILFTTRSRKAAENLTPSQVIQLHELSPDESKQMLAQRLTRKDLFEQEDDVNQLLSTLTYLPLAIAQASAFINNNDVSVSDYITLLHEAGTTAELFGEQFSDPTRYAEMDSTVAKTWHISFHHIRKYDPLAAEYLSFMACIDRIGVPLSLLPRDEFRVRQTKAIGTLKAYAFITERQRIHGQIENEKFFDVHRLVHMAAVWWLADHGSRRKYCKDVTARLEELIPVDGYEKKEKWISYLPHAIHATNDEAVVDELTRTSILSRLGRCQESLGHYAAAVTTYRRTIDLEERELGNEHPNTLTSRNNLASVLTRQGKYDEAEAMHRQTLAVWERVLGSEHPDTLTTKDNLAGVLGKQAKYTEAKVMYRQTLAARKRVLGGEHSDTLMSIGNLAGVLAGQGNYEKAEAMHQRALTSWKKVLGSDHPDTLTSLGNLAGVLTRQGKYQEAEAMNRQALAARDRALGSEHPDTLTIKHNLAGVLARQGRYEEAEAMHRQTLAVWKRVLGSEHPDTLTSIGNLAGALAEQGRYAEAEAMHRQALAARERVLGSEHPSVLTSMNNLAGVLARQGKHETAEAIYRQELALTERVLGAEHPNTLTSIGNLGSVLARQGKYEDAEAMHQRASTAWKEALGIEHPDTLTSINNLAYALASQSKYEEAETMYRQTLAGREKVLGNEHPDTLASINNLAYMLTSRGKHEEAETMYQQTLTIRERVLGSGHPDTLMSVYCLAQLLVKMQRYNESGTFYKRALSGFASVLGQDHPTTRACRARYTKLLQDGVL